MAKFYGLFPISITTTIEKINEAPKTRKYLIFIKVLSLIYSSEKQLTTDMVLFSHW